MVVPPLFTQSFSWTWRHYWPIQKIFWTKDAKVGFRNDPISAKKKKMDCGGEKLEILVIEYFLTLFIMMKTKKTDKPFLKTELHWLVGIVFVLSWKFFFQIGNQTNYRASHTNKTEERKNLLANLSKFCNLQQSNAKVSLLNNTLFMFSSDGNSVSFYLCLPIFCRSVKTVHL